MERGAVALAKLPGAAGETLEKREISRSFLQERASRLLRSFEERLSSPVSDPNGLDTLLKCYLYRI
jgi:hypothetical protein